MRFKYIFCLVMAFSLAVSCHKHDPFPDEENEPEYIGVNKFVAAAMQEYYLWNSKMPGVRTWDMNSFDFFESLVYAREDRWSYLTDDATGAKEGMDGYDTSFGWALIFGNYTNTDNYYAIIQFVYKGSPAEKAGLRRGDIIVAIDGADLTAATTHLLYDAKSLNITLGEYNDGYMDDGRQLTITAEKMELDPIIANTIIDAGTAKVGYVCLSDFFPSAEQKMEAIFADFKIAGVSELVLDLRSNPGGYVSTAAHIASLIAPEERVRKGEVLINNIWNDFQMDFLKRENPSSLSVKFVSSLANKNLNLKRVFVLTGTNTASASELVISGLMPYIDVVMIGEQTVGKYVVCSTFYPTKTFSLDWAIVMAIYRYANVKGMTDFVNGLTPDYFMHDVVLGSDIYELGDEREQLLSCALSIIKGEPVSIQTKALEKNGLRLLQRGDAGFVERPTPLRCGAYVKWEDIVNR